MERAPGSTPLSGAEWPAVRTPLIGRETETAALLRLLRDEDVRMVTTAGPGGAGKTRLAVEVGRRIEADLPDGGAFVPLAAVRSDDRVLSAVATVLEVDDHPAQEPIDKLCAVLRHRRMVLVLDNFEQVAGAGPRVADLLDRCPGVTVLVTSRTALNVRGEHVYRLGPLALPPEASVDSGASPADRPPQDLLAYPSVALFYERARAVHPGFELTDETAEAVRSICLRVDGLPLAIELAAARSHLLPPGALLERLSEEGAAGPLALLTRGPHDLPPRQRSLRKTIAWSHDLLSPEAQSLLGRLSVFVGTWSLDAAEVVCGDVEKGRRGASDGPLPPEAFIDALSELVDMHLVEPDALDSEGPRFVLLETVRGFAREQLVESGEEERLERRHAQTLFAFSEEAARGLESPDERAWHDRVERELPNLHAADGWYGRQGDVASRLRLAAALGPYWLYRGRFGEGRRWLEECLLDGSRLPRGLRANGELWAARLAADQGAIGASSGEADETIRRISGAMEVFAELDDGPGWLRAAEHLAHALTLHEDTERAAVVNEDALRRARASDNRFWLAHFLHRAALLAQLRSDRERATALARETVAVARAIGHARLEARGMQALAQLVPDPERPEEAETALRESLRLCQAAGDKRGVATTLPSLGAVALLRGNARRAAAWYLRSLLVARDMAYWHGQGFSLAGLVATAAIGSEPESAARLHGALTPHLPVLRRGMPPEYYVLYEQLVAGAQADLGDTRFSAAVAGGGDLTWDDALGEGLALARRLSEDLDPLAPETAAGARPEPAPATSHRASLPGGLTRRAVEVLRLIARGQTNREIAETLVVSQKTVMHHSVHIYRKLSVRGRAEATAYAFRHGLVDDPAT